MFETLWPGDLSAGQSGHPIGSIQPYVGCWSVPGVAWSDNGCVLIDCGLCGSFSHSVTEAQVLNNEFCHQEESS